VKPYRVIGAFLALAIIILAFPLGPRVAAHWEHWRMEHRSISKTTPAFVVPDIFDHSVNLSDEQGKVVLLYLWATWCPSCQTETAGLIDLQRRYESRGFAIIGCSRDQDPELVRQFYRQYHLNYPVVMAVPQMQRFFGAALGIRDEEVLTEVPIPTSILIGRDGRIRGIYVGRYLTDLSPAVNRLLADRAEGVGRSGPSEIRWVLRPNYDSHRFPRTAAG
jgi:peroxiredoxin